MNPQKPSRLIQVFAVTCDYSQALDELNQLKRSTKTHKAELVCLRAYSCEFVDRSYPSQKPSTKTNQDSSTSAVNFFLTAYVNLAVAHLNRGGHQQRSQKDVHRPALYRKG